MFLQMRSRRRSQDPPLVCPTCGRERTDTEWLFGLMLIAILFAFVVGVWLGMREPRTNAQSPDAGTATQPWMPTQRPWFPP